MRIVGTSLVLVLVLLLPGSEMWANAANAPSPKEGSSSSSSPTPSGSAESPLLEVMKTSGSSFAVSTWFFLTLGVLTNVDVAPLLWHAQWVTFVPFLEGYAGNSTIIWDEVTPPKGNNPDGKVFYLEGWGSHLWPLALNISWVDMTDTIASDFDTCIIEDELVTTTTASSTSSSAASGRRRLINIEQCSFKDKRNIQRATTFVNVSFSYLIVGIIVIAVQAACHFGLKKQWDTYIGGTHWIQQRDDLDRAKPWTFFHIPLTGPRILFAFVYYVAWQPMIFACMLAISTYHGKYVAVGLIMFVLTILIPFFYQMSWVKKYVVGADTSTLDHTIHKVMYVSDWKGWRDIQDRGMNHTWRKSKIVAGYGILFKDYWSKWKGWLSTWLILQMLILMVMSPLFVPPVPAKIQAVIILAVYLMYFVSLF
jgi:hypothetical protein